MKKGKRLKIITPTDTTGWLFVLPFVIGFIFLFGKPVVESLLYSFNRISVGENGLILTEIAPGFDLEKDILAYLSFKPEISPDLKEMPAVCFN